MAQTFFPEASILVPASPPHPENTEYKVSIGLEQWDESHHHVIKVQMVYDSIVAGRRSPSFPIGTDDLSRVIKAIEELYKREQEKRIVEVW